MRMCETCSEIKSQVYAIMLQLDKQTHLEICSDCKEKLNNNQARVCPTCKKLVPVTNKNEYLCDICHLPVGRKDYI